MGTRPKDAGAFVVLTHANTSKRREGAEHARLHRHDVPSVQQPLKAAESGLVPSSLIDALRVQVDGRRVSRVQLVLAVGLVLMREDHQLLEGGVERIGVVLGYLAHEVGVVGVVVVVVTPECMVV